MWLTILFIIFLISIISFASLAPWVPTKTDDLQRIDKILKSKPCKNFLEMWCWTAWVSLYLAKNNKNTFFTWIELSPFFYLISKLRIYFSWQKNIKIIFWNALKLDFSKFDVVYVFWVPSSVTQKIYPKISEIKNPDFRFISYCFQIEKDNIFEETKHKEPWKLAIFEYRFKL